MRTKMIQVALWLAVGAAAVTAAGCTEHGAHASSGHHGHQTPELLVTSPLRKAVDVEEQFVAQIHAAQHIELRAMERGYLEEVLVDEGGRVEQGQLMFRTMPTLYRAEVARSRAEADFTRIEYENTRMLQDQDVVSDKELALSKARLERAEADVLVARTHLKMSEIRAPFSGIMNRLHVRKGSLLEEGELLTSLSDNSHLWVYFNVAEAQYLDFMTTGALSNQTPVKLLMANHEEFPHEGRVETLEADFHHETGNIAFRATFPNPDGLLRHGETGKVVLTTSIPDALVIPQKATFEILDQKFVFVVDEQGTIHQRHVEIAHELPHVYVVARGLEERDRILVEGLRKVRDQDTIVPRIAPPEEVLAGLDVPAE